MDNILTDDGYLLHKYRPDRSLGSSWHPWVRDGVAQPPIQEDETAITLITLGKHYEVTRDVEFVENLYNSYIRRVADFLVRYRDKSSGLPLPSHDLWEERFAVFTYTASLVSAALKTAAQFAELLGKEIASKRWMSAAKEVQEAIEHELVDRDGRVAKSMRCGTADGERDYTVDVSAFYGLFRFGVLDVHDVRLAQAYERVIASLSVGKDGLGIARYEQDYYYRVHENTPGNPWVLTTCWVAEYEIARAKNAKDLVQPEKRLRWVLEQANEAGLFAEQYDPVTSQPLSVTPLVWSHAQYVTAFLAYTEKKRTLGLCDTSSARQ